jgi:hypothetical protein
VRAAKWQEEDITTRFVRGGRGFSMECTYEAMLSHVQTVVYCVVFVVGKRGSRNAAGCWCDVARGEPNPGTHQTINLAPPASYQRPRSLFGNFHLTQLQSSKATLRRLTYRRSNLALRRYNCVICAS